MARSVKLSDEVMDLVRREAQIQNRSIADQINHWIRLGRAIETSAKFDHNRIVEALAGKRPASDLTEQEASVWLDEFVEKMGVSGSSEEAFFEKRRRLGLGVGLDTGGNLVRATEDFAE
ncbi:TA system antitoxin ParD family protein [Roseibium sp.]|uniref:TA system antitoxin ParD family protein n=1 Tax=Roseibium sp. TaxID=1936156 RepID=UPI003A977F1F